MGRLSTAFLAKTRSLSIEFENPNEVEQAMRHMMIKTRKKLQAIYIKYLLQMLYDKDMGTPEVFHLTKKLCKNAGGKNCQIV